MRLCIVLECAQRKEREKQNIHSTGKREKHRDESHKNSQKNVLVIFYPKNNKILFNLK